MTAYESLNSSKTEINKRDLKSFFNTILQEYKIWPGYHKYPTFKELGKKELCINRLTFDVQKLFDLYHIRLIDVCSKFILFDKDCTLSHHVHEWENTLILILMA